MLFPLKRVMAYDVDADTRQRYAEEMGEQFGLEVVSVRGPKQAVAGCDIVVTAGPIPSAALHH